MAGKARHGWRGDPPGGGQREFPGPLAGQPIGSEREGVPQELAAQRGGDGRRRPVRRRVGRPGATGADDEGDDEPDHLRGDVAPASVRPHVRRDDRRDENRLGHDAGGRHQAE